MVALLQVSKDGKRLVLIGINVHEQCSEGLAELRVVSHSHLGGFHSDNRHNFNVIEHEAKKAFLESVPMKVDSGSCDHVATWIFDDVAVRRSPHPTLFSPPRSNRLQHISANSTRHMRRNLSANSFSEGGALVYGAL